MTRRLLAAALFALAGAAAAAAGDPPARAAGPLAPVEERIAAHVDAHREEALALLERAVAINSGTMNPAGVREVGEVFRGELEGLGFTARWVDGTPFGRAGHLVAERAGDGPRVLLIGHLDTVFEPDSPFQGFRRLPGDAARGPGVIDMKGGDVVLVGALRALEAAGALDGLEVAVVLTGDEEKPGRPLARSREALLEASRGALAALGFEDGDGDPATAVVARRGSVSWRLRVEGTPAHSSQVFRQGIGAGAVYEVARILDAFRRELAGEPYLTANPGVLLGGTTVGFDPEESRGTAFGKANVVAGHAVAAGDLRPLSPEQLRRAQAAMRRIVSRHLPGTRAEIAFDEGYPPMAPREGNRKLLGLLDRVSRDLGLGPVAAVDPRDAGAADVSFVAERVEGALDGLGLMGSGGHTVEETADLGTLAGQTKRAALLLYRLSQGAFAGAPPAPLPAGLRGAD